MPKRLATAPRAAIAVLCLLALLGAGCGSTDKLIPQDDASAMLDDLAKVRSHSDAGECDRAAREVSQLSDKVQELPASVDTALRDRLSEGVRHLEQVVGTDCETQPAVTDTTPTETTTTPPPTTETTPPPTTETTPTTPPETTPPPTTTPTPPAETTPGTGGGGAPAPDVPNP